MSYCELITFKDGNPTDGIEYRNAWGGAARIWSALFDAHVPKKHEYDSWLGYNGNDRRLWDLAKREDLPMFERAVFAATFDHFYVRRENFQRFCADLRAFDAAYPAGEQVNHLPAWADAIEELEPVVEAIGFHGTSVAENPWMRYNKETGDPIHYPLSAGVEVYDWLSAK